MYSVFQAAPRLELIPSLVIKPRIFIMLALGDDDDTMTSGFCFWLGVRQREAWIEIEDALNIPVVFVMQTTVNKLKNTWQMGIHQRQ